MLSKNLNDLLQNILVTNVVIKELPGNNNNKTLIRIHLIPIKQIIKQKYKNITKKRNKHVSHLPKYNKITDNTLVNFSEKNIERCSICYCKFKKCEYFRKLPICGHIYHKKCIDRWFFRNQNNMNCPICRKSYSKEKYKNIKI